MTLIKLDLDGKNSLDEFISRIWILKGFGLNPSKVAVYETKFGYHVYLSTKIKLEPTELLFIQICLGSDYRKELFGFLRLKRGYINPNDWNVLFKQKNKIVTPELNVIKSEETHRGDLSKLIANRIESGVRRKGYEINWEVID